MGSFTGQPTRPAIFSHFEVLFDREVRQAKRGNVSISDGVTDELATFSWRADASPEGPKHRVQAQLRASFGVTEFVDDDPDAIAAHLKSVQRQVAALLYGDVRDQCLAALHELREDGLMNAKAYRRLNGLVTALEGV